MGIREMQGTPAYLEYVGPRGRKRRKHCIYNKENICKNSSIQMYQCKCVGRMYCSSYKNDKENNDDITSIAKTYGSRNIKKSKIDIKQKILEEELINKNVKLYDLTYDELLDITIVADEKKDILDNKISVKSPLGQALCNKQKEIGSVFEVTIENTKNRYKLISIDNNKKIR